MASRKKSSHKKSGHRKDPKRVAAGKKAYRTRLRREGKATIVRKAKKAARTRKRTRKSGRK